MPGTTLLKPGTIPGDVLLSGGLIATDGTFLIKLQRMTIDYVAPLVETSGDTDTDPTWENGEWIYAQIVAAGFMISTGIAVIQLVEQDTPFSFTFTLGGTVATALEAIVESIDIGWDRRGPLVPIQISIRTTDAAVTNIVAP